MSHQHELSIRGTGSGMTLPRAVRAEWIRLRRAPLVALHLVCAVLAGLGCGLYFAFSPWDTALGADAYAQLLGAMMPLMVGIVCGLDVDAEGTATRFSSLLAVPSRGRAVAARIFILWLLGALTLALSVMIFAVFIVSSGRLGLGAGAYAGMVLGLAFGSLPLYLIFYAVALRWGRNVTIGVGTVGLLLAVFSVGGLAHGLVTGTLTTAQVNFLTWLPTSWAVLLGSLPVELSIASGGAGSLSAAAIAGSLGAWSGICAAVSLILAGLLIVWISHFEPSLRGE